MRKTVFLLMGSITLNLFSQTFNTDPCFTRIFEDNFNSLNTANWAVQDRLSWTDDQTWDLPANVTFPTNSGLLRIRLERRTHNGVPFCGGELTSNASYTPGIYVETRARNPTGVNGFSNAVWLWGGLNNNGTCNCACGYCDPNRTLNKDASIYSCGCQNYNEIDFLEYFGSGLSRTNRNRFWCTQNGQCVRSIENSYEYGQDIPTDWHTYGTYWNNGNTSFYYDDKLTLTGNTVSANPMNIDIDLWAHKWTVKANTTFPKFFDVDYIRVFRINRSNNQCSIAINNPANLTGYTWNLKRSIIFNTTVLPANQRLSFWATNLIELGGGNTNFDIPTSNQEITFAIGECW